MGFEAVNAMLGSERTSAQLHCQPVERPCRDKRFTASLGHAALSHDFRAGVAGFDQFIHIRRLAQVAAEGEVVFPG